VLEQLKKKAVRLERNSVRRYANNHELGRTSFASLEERFGFPTFVVHRGDLHTALLNKALELGTVLKVNVRIFAGSRRKRTRADGVFWSEQSFVEDVNFEKTSVLVKGQGWKKHDVLIGADGIKSSIRSKMMARRGEVDETIDTGEAAYRELTLLGRSLTRIEAHEAPLPCRGDPSP
jgi:salicylate hydroxylase